MDVLQRIRELMEERGWSSYRLAVASGLSQSTIANMFRRNTVPSIPTLEYLCNGFGISLSEFFTGYEDPQLLQERTLLVEKWDRLNEVQKETLLHIMDVI